MKAGITVESEYGKGSNFIFEVENCFDNEVQAMLFTPSANKERSSIGTSANLFSVNQALLKLMEEKRMHDFAENRINMISKNKDRTVLIIDDSELNLEVMEAIFQSFGFASVLCSNPIESLEIIKNRLTSTECIACSIFDIVMLDMEMPFMNGK